MAYQTQSFPLLSFDEANPFLTGFSKGQDIGMKQKEMKAKDLANELAKIQVQYAPLTAQADAESKMAYARLLGPQYVAKLMGNQDILANMSPDQRTQALQQLYSAGLGNQRQNQQQSTQTQNQDQLNIPVQNQERQQYSMTENQLNSNSQVQGQGQLQGRDQPNIMSKPNVNNNSNLSTLDSASIASMPPGASYVIRGNNPQVSSEQQVQPAQQDQSNIKTFPENVGTYKGIIEEGVEAGKIRANDIQLLNDSVYQGEENQATFNEISKDLSSPVFEKMRQVPLLSRHELGYYQKLGTPEEQQMVGNFLANTGKVVINTAHEFKGSFRTGEQRLVNEIKVNPSDTLDVAKGKLEALSYMNKFLTERARLTSKIMEKNHVSKLTALNEADKQLKGENFRQQIHNQLNPKPTYEDINFMAKKYNKTPEEITKMLKSKGIL